MPLEITRMHGLGDDDADVNVFEQSVDDPPALAKTIRDRPTGVGGDGLILIGGMVLCLAASAIPKANARQLPDRLADNAIAGSGWFNVEKALTQADLKGRPVMLEFWATWCAPCIAQVPTLNDLHDRYAERGLVVLALTEEQPSVVAPYIRHLGIKYAVAAGIPSRREGRPSVVPFAALYSAKGALVVQGDPSRVYRRLHAIMRVSPPDATFEDLTKPGATVGDFPRRPEKFRPFEPPALEQKISEILGEGHVISETELNDVYAFYWMNLPAPGWKGDVSTREHANSALLQIHKSVRDKDLRKVIASLRGQLMRRISRPDPDWGLRASHARHMAYLFEPDDAEALAALRSALKRERNPLLRFYLSRSLAALDSSLPALPITQSAFLEAQERYGDSSRGWRKLFGPPKDLAEYPKYVEGLEEDLARSGMDHSIIRRLEADYGKHAGQRASELLIRAHIVSTLTGSANTVRRESPELRKPLQETALRLLHRSEPDVRIRLLLLWLIESAGFDAIDEDRLVKRLDEMLSAEPDPQVRATIEYEKLVIVDPEAIK